MSAPSLAGTATTALTAIAMATALPARTAAQQLGLREAVERALASHPSVAVAAAATVAAEEASAAARAARVPSAAASASLVRFQEPMVVAPLHAFDPTNPPRFDQTLVQGVVGFEYALFDGGARGSRIRGADAMEEAATLGRAVAEHETVERTVAAYVSVLTARAVLDAARAQLVALEAETDRVERNVAAGTAAEVELIRASAGLQQALAERASAEAQVGLAERRLARATGLPVERVAGQPLADVRLRAVPAHRASDGDPRLERAERAVVAAGARLDEERSGRLPRLDASAGLQDFGTLEGGHVVEWQAGLRVTWPLFTGGARSARVRRAEADLAAVQAERDATELALDDELDAARTLALEADARAEALAAAMDQWRAVARIAALALEAGSGVQRDLLEAQAGLFAATAGQARARYEALLARVRVARAEGALDARWIDAALEEAR